MLFSGRVSGVSTILPFGFSKRYLPNMIYKPCSVKRRLNIFAKSIDSCRPARTAQADMERNFSHFFNFSACQRTIPHRD